LVFTLSITYLNPAGQVAQRVLLYDNKSWFTGAQITIFTEQTPAQISSTSSSSKSKSNMSLIAIILLAVVILILGGIIFGYIIFKKFRQSHTEF